MRGLALLLLVHALAGGLGVVAFALLAETVRPKEFSGLFSAAPSIALASLIVALVAVGPGAAARNASGMVAGGFGMVAFCLVATATVRRERALLGSLLAIPAWFLAAGLVYLAVFR